MNRIQAMAISREGEFVEFLGRAVPDRRETRRIEVVAAERPRPAG